MLMRITAIILSLCLGAAATAPTIAAQSLSRCAGRSPY